MSLLLHNFCIYHINPQGHEVSNAGSKFIMRYVSLVLNFGCTFFFNIFSLGSVMCLGVTVGAYVLTLFAVCIFISQDLSVDIKCLS